MRVTLRADPVPLRKAKANMSEAKLRVLEPNHDSSAEQTAGSVDKIREILFGTQIKTYEARFARGEEPRGLDKEYVRRTLADQGFRGEGTPPPLTDEVRVEAARRYIQLCELITGRPLIVMSVRIGAHGMSMSQMPWCTSW